MKMGYTIALTIGIIMFIISLVLYRQSIDFIKNGSRTTATVIELKKNSDSEGTTYKPIFKFKTFTDEEIIYKYHISSSPPSFYIGEEVSIVYNIDNPKNAKILTYFGSFFWTIVLMAFSMPLIVIACGYYLTKQFLK